MLENFLLLLNFEMEIFVCDMLLLFHRTCSGQIFFHLYGVFLSQNNVSSLLFN